MAPEDVRSLKSPVACGAAMGPIRCMRTAVALKMFSAFVSSKADATLKLSRVHGECWGICGRTMALALGLPPRSRIEKRRAGVVECGGPDPEFPELAITGA